MKRTFLALLVALTIITALLGFQISEPTAGAPQEEFELRFELMVLSWDDWSVHTGEVLAEQLAKVGIKLDVTPLDDAVMYPRIDKRDYVLYEMALGYDAIPTHLYYRFHSSQDYEGGGNYQSYHNSKVDELLDKAWSTADREKAREYLFEVQKILAEEVPYVPLFITNDVHVFAKGWTNWTLMPGGPISPLNRWTPVYIYHPEKTTFIIAYPAESETLSPLAAGTGRSLWYSMLVYDSLLAYDENFNLVPWLAESYEVSPDGKTITFKLREGLKWHDGTPLTSKDVAFTFQYIKENKPTGGMYTPDIIKFFNYAETPDDRTVIIHLTEPYLFALDAFGFEYIVPEHIWKDIESWDWDRSLAPQYAIGSGPFKFVKWVEGEYVELVKNEDYWIKGKPNVEKLIIRVIDTEEARILAIKRGEVATKRYELIPAYLETLRGDPNVQLPEVVSMWDYVLGFNTKVWPFNITKFRQAIAYAINKDEIVEKAALGAGTVSETFVPKEYFGPYWANENVKKYEYNPEKAKQMLAELGFRDIDNDGILEYAPEVTPTPTPTPSPTPAPKPARTYLIAGIIIIIIAIVVIYMRMRGS